MEQKWQHVAVAKLQSLTMEDYMAGIMRTQKLNDLCRKCYNLFDDPRLATQFKDIIARVVIRLFFELQESWLENEILCNSNLVSSLKTNERLYNILTEKLAALGTTIEKYFQLDAILRNAIVDAIEISQGYPVKVLKQDLKKEKDKKNEKQHAIDIDSLSLHTTQNQEESKADMEEVVKSPLYSPKRRRIHESNDSNMPTTNIKDTSQLETISPAKEVISQSENPLAYTIGKIVGAFVSDKKQKTRVIQVRVSSTVNKNHIRVEDADPSVAAFWELPNDHVIDYRGKKYTAEDFRTGDQVLALFSLGNGIMSSEFYVGTVTGTTANTIVIRYSDGDRQAIAYDQLFKASELKDKSLIDKINA